MNSNGFTVIEVISVVILLGILSAYVAVTSMDMLELNESITEINQLKFHLKYAQIKSINSPGSWGIDFTGSTYALFHFDDSPSATIEYRFFPEDEKNISNPTKADCEKPKPDSSKYSTYNEFLWFDSLGRAHKNNTYNTSIGGISDISANLDIVTVSGGAKVITIQTKTGYVKCDFK